MLLTIIIPTKNEAANIERCVKEVQWAKKAGVAEIIVVDNDSSDDTQELARELGAKVLQQGPERSVQRNRGAKEAAGKYLLFLDADMIVPRPVLEEVLEMIQGKTPPDAVYIREQMMGSGFFTRIRNFERRFYDATCIDAFRVIKKSLFDDVGGYDESLCGPEDWDLDHKILSRDVQVALTKGALQHNEGQISFRRLVEKKSYYAASMNAYREKWNNDRIIRKQLGIWYRFFIVFIEKGKWRMSLAAPHMLFAVWLYKLILCVFLILPLAKGERVG